MDNGLVLCMNTLHRVGEIVERLKKCPRTTVKNKLHVTKVWDDKGKKHIFIPTLINDYNHWMCGVDIVDQHISTTALISDAEEIGFLSLSKV
eukprot:8528786-Ditylum_brightwellii.AAC.1